jgi:hypothetical protein
MAMTAIRRFLEFCIKSSIKGKREESQIDIAAVLWNVLTKKRGRPVLIGYSSSFHTLAPGWGKPMCARTRQTN